jgi:class 3 adenylate cyclase
MVRIARSSTSSVNDIFGTTVNRCAKLNRNASTNGVVIGENFYELLKDNEEYLFKKVENKLMSSDHGYVGYTVSIKSLLENNSSNKIR